MVRIETLVRQGTEVVTDDTTSTRYQLASVSKQFTAAAVLLLARDGVLRLDDPLDRWVGGWPGVTLHHLLTHTSGIGHWEDYPMIDLAARVEPDDLLETFRSVPVRHAPGGPWRYSSPGYVLLAHVVEKASGSPYRTFLFDRIFGPLGLTSTFAGMPGEDEPNLADGHDAGGRPVPSRELDVTGMGAGDVWSTAGDVLTWLDAVQSGSLLGEPYRSLMLTCHAGEYGYGVFTGEVEGRPWWYHSGDNAGFKAFVACIPSTDRRIVLLANTDAAGDLGAVASGAAHG